MCLTVHALIQIKLGRGKLALYFEKLKFKLLVVDEGHQLDLAVFGASALFAQSLLVLFDHDQFINYGRSADRVSRNAVRQQGEYWAWQRSVKGRSSLPIWSCWAVDPRKLLTTYRFGNLGVKYLNMVFPPYIKGDNMETPLNPDRMTDVAEKNRIPDTRFRFVVFKKCRVFGSVFRGWLDETDSEAPRPRTPGAELVEVIPFGGSMPLWWNMFHEGANFLRALQDGSVPRCTHDTISKL